MFVKKSNVLMKFVNGVKLDESIPCLRIGDNIINLCINLINISKLLSFIALFCEKFRKNPKRKIKQCLGSVK